MADIIQQRRDTAARWAQYNPILLEGEVGYVTDNPNQYKIGNGRDKWNDLPLRGYTGTITQETGSDENAVMSQKAVTAKLSELGVYVENPEFIEVTTDSEDKILEGIQKDGTKVIGGDLQVNGQISNEGIDSIEKRLSNAEETLSYFESIDNSEWLSVTTDSEGKILEGINSEGEKEINVPLKKLNLTQDGMTTLVNELEEHGISGGGISQEEADIRYAVKSIEDAVSQNRQDIDAIEASIDVNPPDVVALRNELDGVEARVDSIEQAGGLTPPTLTLYKKISSELIVTQAELNSWEGHVVEVIADLNLTGNTNFTLPTNTIIFMNGGQFVSENYSGTLNLNGAYIKAEPYQIIDNSINLSGELKADIAYGEWFGAKGDGVHYDAAAFNMLYKNVQCNAIHLLPKTYNIESRIDVKSNLVGCSGSLLQRNKEFIDVNIISPVDSSTCIDRVATLTVESVSGLKVGMGVQIVNRRGDARKLEAIHRMITSIDASTNTITCVGKFQHPSTAENDFASNTASLISGYPLVVLNYTAGLYGVHLDGGLDAPTSYSFLADNSCVPVNPNSVYPYDRVYWEFDNTVGNFNEPENMVIRDCVIKNSLSDAIMFYKGKNAVIDHNYILHCGSNGVHYSCLFGCQTINNLIFDCNMNYNTGHNEGAITYSSLIGNVFISNNIFDNSKTGIGGINNAANAKTIISNNLITSFRDSGIDARNELMYTGTILKDYIIRGNRFVGSQDDIDYWAENYGLNKPYIERIESIGYGVKFYGVTDSPCKYENVIIDGNSFRDCGICMYACKIGTVNGNVFTSTHEFTGIHPEFLIEFRGSNMNFVGNIIDVTSSVVTDIIIFRTGEGTKANIANTMYKSNVNLISSSSSSEGITESNNVRFGN